jgi:hypothetical protein
MAFLQQEAIPSASFLRPERVARHLPSADHGPAAFTGNGRRSGHTSAAGWALGAKGRHRNQEL